MRIGIAVDYGKYANASSLNLIAKKMFLEFGKLMNKKKTFTVTAIKYEDIGMGDVNEHFDCICVPNMGGYRFPHLRALTSKNLIIGVVGIDEVVLGEQVFKTKSEWNMTKPIIEREISKWEKHVDKIKVIHVSTNSDKEQLIKYLKVPQDKIHVISYGVDHKVFMPPTNKEKTRKKIRGKFYLLDSPYFIHISEWNWARKNIFRMLEAFEKARSDGIEQELLIVGKIDPIVHKKALTIDGVRVIGFVSEEHLVELIQGSDALILPSLHEGFGFPLVEAMACGTPIITSNVFSPPEIVGDGGLFADPYNVTDITNKIIEISRDKKLQKILSEKAYERSKKFLWKDAANKLLSLIEENTNYDSHNFSFINNQDLAAYRTIVTVCEILPSLGNVARQDLLEFNYSRIISWALEVGFKDPDVGDFLIPFKDWLVSHAELDKMPSTGNQV